MTVSAVPSSVANLERFVRLVTVWRVEFSDVAVVDAFREDIGDDGDEIPAFVDRSTLADFVRLLHEADRNELVMDTRAKPPPGILLDKTVLLVEDSLIVALDVGDIATRLGTEEVLTYATVLDAL